MFGNGRGTLITSDPWLPHAIEPYISFEGVNGLENSMVSSFMVVNELKWDSDLV